MTKNGWGLIGTGRIADDRILPGINAHRRQQARRRREPRPGARATTFAKKFGAQHAYTSYEEMLRNPDVTVVAIHTPNAQHADQAVAAARAGKHVFCDKPMATSVADAERIVRECEKAGVKLGINFHNRFMPCFIETRRIIASGEIGDVQLVQLEASPGARPGARLGDLARRSRRRRAWARPTASACTSTTSCATCWRRRSRWCRRSSIRRAASWKRPTCRMFRFANGVIAQLSVHENSPFPHNDFVIYGAKGRILGRGLTRSRAGGELQVTTTDGKTRSQEFPAINAHGACVAAFSEALLNGRDPVPSGIDGLRSVQLTDAMARSAGGGVHVRLAD